MAARLSILALSLIAGCGSGAAVIASGSGGSSSGSANTPTQVSLIGIVDKRDSPARVDYLLVDPENDSASVEVRFTTDGTFAGSTVIAAESGLSTSAAGVQHSTDWDFEPIFGSGFTPNVLVFVVLTGKSNIDLGVNAASTSIGDDPPVVNLPGPQFPAPGEEAVGILPVVFTVSDSGGDDVKVKVQFSTDFASGTPTWTNARPAGIQAGTPTPEFAFDPVTAFPFGSNLIFAWDTEFDLPGKDIQVQMRIQATEVLAPALSSNLGISPTFRIDNNVPPTIGMDVVGFALNPDRSRGIPVPFVLDDPENDPVQVVFQWREQSGTFPALPTNIVAMQSLLADPAQRRAAQIATERPRVYEGRVLAVSGGDRARLPELATSAALLNTRRPSPADSLQGLDLEILRTSRIPAAISATWTAGNPLTGPAAAVVADSGELLVVDEPTPAMWRLRAIDSATGTVGTTFATNQPGQPTALARIPGSVSLLVASQVSGTWSIWLVDPLTPSCTEVFRSDSSLAPAPVRGLLGFRDSTCLVTVGDTLVRVRFPAGTPSSAATLLGTTLPSPLSVPHGLALDPLDADLVYVADNGSNRVLRFDLSTHALTRLRTPAPGTPRPTALAFDDGGSRLLVVTDNNVGDSVRELRAFQYGLHRALGLSSLDAFVITSTLPSSVSSLATGGDGSRVLCSPSANELFVGGGVVQTRRILSYDPVQQTVLVDAPFQPAVVPGAEWRIADVASKVGDGTSDGELVFVWDSLDVAGSTDVELRAVAFDKDLGPLAPSSPKTLRGAHDTTAQSVGNCCNGIPCDIEGDGDMDFLAAGNARLQTSPMTFTTIANAVPGIDAVADINLDGLIDVAFDGRVFLQNSASAATFFAGVTAVPGGGTIGDVGDVDGNGLVDLLLMDGRIFQQGPLGTWLPGASAFTSGFAFRTLLRDFDGDGDLDAVVALDDGFSGADLVQFERLANGTFSANPIGILSNLNSFADMELEHLDFDGGLDVVAGLDQDIVNSIQGLTTVRLSNGTPPIEISPPPGSIGVTEVEVSDLDADGLRELLIVPNGVASYLSYQPSPGRFASDARGSLTTKPRRIADIDGDRLPDLVDSQVHFARNQGTILDPSPADVGSAFVGFDDCAFGDFDRDGDSDLFAVDRSVAMTQMFPQLRPGAFSNVPTVGFEDDNVPAKVRAADVTGDGFTDAVIVMGFGAFVQFRAPGFNAPSVFAAEIADEQVVALRGAGAPDILLLTDQFAGGELTSYRNDDTEVFLGSGFESFEAADLDNDGDYDIAVGDGSDVRILRQGPIDTFASVVAVSGETGRLLGAADLDSNGRLDLIVSGGATTRLWLQQLNGTFTLASPAIPFVSTRAVPADLNGDALDDLLLFTSSGARVAVQINPGIFVENPVLATLGIFANAVDDVDGDGELDAAFAAGPTIRMRFGGR